jgi:hypothetical protein
MRSTKRERTPARQRKPAPPGRGGGLPDPCKETVLFAAFIYRLRCPKFARGLVSQDGMRALGVAVDSWKRGCGRPKKGDTRSPKWEACDALMKAAGLVGMTQESLENDWKAWEARTNNKK